MFGSTESDEDWLSLEMKNTQLEDEMGPYRCRAMHAEPQNCDGVGYITDMARFLSWPSNRTKQ